MSRRRKSTTREIIPDPRFGDSVLAKFIRSLMVHGKKNVAERIRHVDRIEWLASHSQLIDSANAESDFIHRCHCHWAEL